MSLPSATAATTAEALQDEHLFCLHPKDKTKVILYCPSSLFPCFPSDRLHRVIKSINAASSSLQLLNNADQDVLHAPLHGKRFLLIANPCSGKGSRRAHHRRIALVRRMLCEAGTKPDDVVVHETRCARDATHLIATMEEEQLVSYTMLLVMGGDGTLHEVFQGLTNRMRESKHQVQLPPIIPVPAGTGNAVAVSMSIFTVEHAIISVVHAIARNIVAKPVCLLRYRPLVLSENDHDQDNETNTEKNGLHSTIASDTIDIENASIASKTLLCGMQWGLPAQVDQGTEWMRFAGDLRLTLGALGHIASRTDYYARFVITVDPSLQQEINVEMNQEELFKDDGDMICKRTAENEYTLDGRFVMVVAWNWTRIARDFCVTPFSKISEVDVFDILLVPSANLTRAQMLDVLLHSDDGSFIHSSKLPKGALRYFKAKKMAVLKLTGDFLTVDGESIPVRPFVLDIAPESGSVRVFDVMR